MPRFVQAIKAIVQAEQPIIEEPPSATELILAPIQKFLQDFANDKSQSELLFLLSILLAVSLFAVILPLYESLFGSCSLEEDDDGIMMEISKIEELSNNSTSGGMRMYKPGVGVVEMSVEEIAELTLIRSSSGGCSSRGSSDCDSSRSSIGSIGSCSLETIEESEEEYYSEDEE